MYFPLDIWKIIIGYCNYNGLIRLRLTCKIFNKEIPWKRVFDNWRNYKPIVSMERLNKFISMGTLDNKSLYIHMGNNIIYQALLILNNKREISSITYYDRDNYIKREITNPEEIFKAKLMILNHEILSPILNLIDDGEKYTIIDINGSEKVFCGELVNIFKFDNNLGFLINRIKPERVLEILQGWIAGK